MRVFTHLLFFISSFSFSQQQQIQIRLVNGNVGSAYSVEWAQVPTTSNDAGLNAIFSNYNVSGYETTFHPVYEATIGFVTFTGDSNQFIVDLLAYNSVVNQATLTSFHNFTDALRVVLVNPTIGIPLDTENPTITNDNGLNSIFQAYNVFAYHLSSDLFPNSIYYDLACNCNATDLEIALDNYNEVITDSHTFIGTFLSSPDQQIEKLEIAPNPVSNYLLFNTEIIGANLSLFDLSGKQLMNVRNVQLNTIDTSELPSGVYILKIEGTSGMQSVKRFVKI